MRWKDASTNDIQPTVQSWLDTYVLQRIKMMMFYWDGNVFPLMWKHGIGCYIFYGSYIHVTLYYSTWPMLEIFIHSFDLNFDLPPHHHLWVIPNIWSCCSP